MKEKLLEILNTVLTNNSLNTVVELDVKRNLQSELELDSIMLAELTVRIEDEFDIDIFENGMVHTIEDILDILKT